MACKKQPRFPNYSFRVKKQMDYICDELNELHETYIRGDEVMPYCDMEEYNELFDWYKLMCEFLNETARVSRKYEIGVRYEEY